MNFSRPFINVLHCQGTRNPPPCACQGDDPLPLLVSETVQARPAQAALINPLATFPSHSRFLVWKCCHARVSSFEYSKESCLNDLLCLRQPREIEVGRNNGVRWPCHLASTPEIKRHCGRLRKAARNAGVNVLMDGASPAGMQRFQFPQL